MTTQRFLGFAGRTVLLAALFTAAGVLARAQAVDVGVAKAAPKADAASSAQTTATKPAPVATSGAKRVESSHQVEELSAETPGEERANGPNTNVKVHGHWTITVKNPDGTKVSQTEFENSLQVSGASLLANLLAQQAVVGDFSVIILENATFPPEQYNLSTSSSGGIGAAHSQYCNSTDNFCAYGLTTTVTNNTLVFSDSFVQTGAANTIWLVSTNAMYCAASMTSSQCFATTATNPQQLTQGYLTSTTIPTPIAVSQGQIVQVTVTISFS